MDLVEDEDVADLHVAQTGDSEQVARGEDVFSACEGGDDILGGLGADELEGRGGGVGCRVQGACRKGPQW